MIYEVTKAAHIVSFVVWISGMTAVSLYLMRPHAELLKFMQSFDRAVTTPAMLLTWIFGGLLAIQGGWFGVGWLWVKIVLVTALSGLHGAITGRLRRHGRESTRKPDPLPRAVLPAGFALLVSIVLLVTTKTI